MPDFGAKSREQVRIIKWGENENEKQYRELITNVCNLSYHIWNTFAYGARIMKHDKIYKSMVPEWKDKFDEQVIILSSMINEFYLKTLKIIKPTDYDERAISKHKFVNHILECRKNTEIAYINFSAGKKEIIPLPENVRDLPEYLTLFNEGQLDWEIIKRLSDQELRNLIEKCMGNRPIYVSYVEKNPNTITYRTTSNLSSLVMPVDAQGKVIY